MACCTNYCVHALAVPWKTFMQHAALALSSCLQAPHQSWFLISDLYADAERRPSSCDLSRRVHMVTDVQCLVQQRTRTLCLGSVALVLGNRPWMNVCILVEPRQLIRNRISPMISVETVNTSTTGHSITTSSPMQCYLPPANRAVRPSREEGLIVWRP